jgi:hypothetical protein
MSMTGTDIAKIARPILNDSVSDSQKWDDPQIERAINAGVKRIIDLRPDARIDTDGTLLTITPITALSGTISIADDFQDPLVQYVVAYCLQYHAGELENRARAAVHMAQFAAMLGVPNG